MESDVDAGVEEEEEEEEGVDIGECVMAIRAARPGLNPEGTGLSPSITRSGAHVCVLNCTTASFDIA